MDTKISKYVAYKNSQTYLPITEISRFVHERFNEIKKTEDLVHFHTVNKYLFMSYSPQLLDVLGNIVANHEKNSFPKLIEDYRLQLNRILTHSPSTKSHTNTLYHILGHFSKNLEQDERQAIMTLIDTFRNGNCSLTIVLSIMKEFTTKFDKTYLIRQTYFLLFLNSYGSK